MHERSDGQGTHILLPMCDYKKYAWVKSPVELNRLKATLREMGSLKFLRFQKNIQEFEFSSHQPSSWTTFSGGMSAQKNTFILSFLVPALITFYLPFSLKAVYNRKYSAQSDRRLYFSVHLAFLAKGLSLPSCEQHDILYRFQKGVYSKSS